MATFPAFFDTNALFGFHLSDVFLGQEATQKATPKGTFEADRLEDGHGYICLPADFRTIWLGYLDSNQEQKRATWRAGANPRIGRVPRSFRDLMASSLPPATGCYPVIRADSGLSGGVSGHQSGHQIKCSPGGRQSGAGDDAMTSMIWLSHSRAAAMSDSTGVWPSTSVSARASA